VSRGPRSAPPELPGFTPDRWIGGGGFADVFLYTQLRPSRSVAVKILRREHLSAQALANFDAEADIMAEVSTHPYIVTIFASGVSPDGRPYIVMEHYPQPNFGERARGGALDLTEVLRTGIQVASAVETAHRAGIVHRDI
jgi:serine/threonine protein kinase